MPTDGGGLPHAEAPAREGSAVDQAVFWLDPDGRIASWSAGAARLKGYPAEEIIGRHFSVFYLPEVADSGYPDWELRHATEVGVHTDEGWRVRQDGSLFWASVVITPQYTPEGAVSGFIKVTRDETQPQARLRRSDQRFSDLFAVSPVGIGVFDEAGWLLDANRALAELLGKELSELYGQHSTDLLSPHDQGEGFLPRPAAPGRNVVRQRVLTGPEGDDLLCDLHLTESTENDGRTFWLVAFHDVTERHRHVEQLRYQATHDDVTGLPNRRAVLELLEQLLDGTEAKRLAVLFCDIDQFKRINDALGHEAGDEVLVAVAQRLKGNLPEDCIPARQAGDEFLIVCPNVDAVGGLQAFAETVSGLLRTTLFIQGQELQISASVGAVVLGESPTTGADLVRFADAAMFEAKNRGPGRFQTADDDLIAATDRKVELENQLREALASDGLALHYQPVVNADGTIITAEALVRWPHPVHGLLGPDVFLPVAAHTGLLKQLDRWVLRTALREAATWPAPGGQDVTIAVNLAALTPGEADFADMLADIIAESGIDHRRVILELVETALIDLPARPAKAMRELAEQGVRFAVDDFGTGYSSLARLTELPVEIIKIDRQFVSGINTQFSHLAVARAITDLSRALGRSVIAEGVETDAQFHTLSRLGVDGYQGWLFSRAVPPHDLHALLDHTTITPTPPVGR